MTYSYYLDYGVNHIGEFQKEEHFAKLLNHGVESKNKLYIKHLLKACLQAGYLSKKPKFRPSMVTLY